jgi:hypothetical protein
MAQVIRSIEVDGPVDAVHAEWLRFEEVPRCAAHTLTAGVRWRAEVLTFEPLGSRTRVKLRVEYEPTDEEQALPLRMEAVLQAFAYFRERGVAAAAEARAE